GDLLLTTANILMIFRQASIFVFFISLVLNVLIKEVFHIMVLRQFRISDEKMIGRKQVDPAIIKDSSVQKEDEGQFEKTAALDVEDTATSP
ncbi:hypothetical protein HDV05_002327, partial [Chytridiales sp. JEL 0842]